MEQYYNMLKTIPLFYNMQDNELEKLLSCLNANIKRYSKSSTILRVEDKITEIGIILSGIAQISKEDFMGNKMILTNLKLGDLFAETLVFVRAESSPVNVVALKDCTIMFIDYKKIFMTCKEACLYHIKLTENLLGILATKNVILNNKIDIISKRSIREKLLAYFNVEIKAANSLSFVILYTKSELADYLCIDRSAMSRELSKMQQEGLLEFDKNSFVIKDKLLQPR